MVKTYLGKSKIHGFGVFAGEPIRKGQRVWRFVHGFDRIYSHRQFAKLPKPAQEFIQFHGYGVDDEILLTVDNDRHMNHSENANTDWYRGHIVATRNIAKDAEITNNYRLFDPGYCASFLAGE